MKADTMNEKTTQPQDVFVELRALTEALLTRADADYLRRQVDAAIEVMAKRGYSPPTPWPDEDFGVAVWGRSRAASEPGEVARLAEHEPADRDGIVKRVRRLANIAGIPTALPEDDATVYGALFTCLGMIASKFDREASWNEHDQGIIADLEAMASNQAAGFWPQILAVGALRLIRSPVLASMATSPASEPAGWREALQFYADKSHFTISDESAWDMVSGEPQNFWCDEEGTATVEDGTVAAMALAGTPLPNEDDESASPASEAQGAHEVIRIWNERARKFGFDGVAGMLNAFRHGEAKAPASSPVAAGLLLALEQERQKFQQETRRTSELSVLLQKWIDRHVAEHGPGPWARRCDVCSLVGESQELLGKPINTAAPQTPVAAEGQKAVVPTWWKSKMLSAAASTGDAATIRLAAQLAECLPCPECDFVREHCKCATPAEGQKAATGKQSLQVVQEADALRGECANWAAQYAEKQQEIVRLLAEADALREALQNIANLEAPEVDADLLLPVRLARAALAQQQAPQQGERQ